MEKERLLAHRKRKANWKKWGPYLSERSWGTVRESRQGEDPWTSFPFEEAHRRVYRFGEDGLAGICDRFQRICFAFAFWNGKDPLLKERLFGLSSPEGNHGEDVKERYFYLDATPTSSYLKMRYHYPIDAFPYEKLRTSQGAREAPEFEIEDTGIFERDRYFAITIEYAKAGEDELYCRCTIQNKSGEKAPLTVLPTIWFRNTWQSGKDRPHLFLEEDQVHLQVDELGDYYFSASTAEWIFCENEEGGEYPKESFHRYILEGKETNPAKEGTKAAPVYRLELEPKETKELLFRLANTKSAHPFSKLPFAARIQEADAFYEEVQNKELSEEMKAIQRQAFAGLLFSRQFYYLDQLEWKRENPSSDRNEEWQHLTSFDILSVPDKWEYPYFCAWDTAFHCIPLVLVDPDFAKRQLELMTREWYMHPNGQLPAYEWAFSDVNPPVHAWALWRTYKIDGKVMGELDRPFLLGSFNKLLLNFTWWVNKKDTEGKNIFQGGFLGMDNISVFDRSRTLPTGGHIDQSDGTSWMSFFCISMMKIALHLSEEEPTYQDMATKFFEHFLRIASAMTHCGRGGEHSLWNREDGFFYDLLHLPDNTITPLKVRSLVGLLPLLAVETIEQDLLEKMPVFHRRMNWFLEKRPEVSCNIACLHTGGVNDRRLLSIVDKEQLLKILSRMLDEEEFLSPFGIRSVSKFHEKHPYVFHANGTPYEVKYDPGESDSEMFGGNSNWRGPIWFPINFLLIEALQKFHHYYGDTLKVEFPTRSGHLLNLWEISEELSKRLITLFTAPLQNPHEPLFYEYFNPETGKGLGASHQTGWTALVAKLIQQTGSHLS